MNQPEHAECGRVLVVAADLELQALAARVLGGGSPEYRVEAAFGPKEGLRQLADARIAARPHDVAMGELGRSWGPDALVIASDARALSGTTELLLVADDLDWVGDAELRRLAELGDPPVLVKPLDALQLRQLVRVRLSRRRARVRLQKARDGLETEQSVRDASTTQCEASRYRAARFSGGAGQWGALQLEAIGAPAAGIAHGIHTLAQVSRDPLATSQTSFQRLAGPDDGYGALLEAADGSGLEPALVERIQAAATEAGLDDRAREVTMAPAGCLDAVCTGRTICAVSAPAPTCVGRSAPVDLNRAMEQALAVARDEWLRPAEMVLDLDDELPLFPCHADGIDVALVHLVVHAVQAMADVVGTSGGDRGQIVVSTARVAGGMEIRVSDPGPTIGGRIWHRGHNPAPTTRPSGLRIGHGLALVATTIVGRYGASVEIETGGRRGTAFVVRLPVPAANA